VRSKLQQDKRGRSGGPQEYWHGGEHCVYIPQSYNFAGNLVVVPKKQVTPLEIESGKVMAFIVSGRVSGF